MFFDPQTHLKRGIAFTTIVNGLFSGFAKYPEISIKLIVCILRDNIVGSESDKEVDIDSAVNTEPSAWTVAGCTVN